MNSLQMLFLTIFKKILLSSNMENTRNGKERRKTEHISVQHEQNVRSFFSFSPRRVGLSQKPFHTIVPLKG
jgi:hypothetical protein